MNKITSIKISKNGIAKYVCRCGEDLLVYPAEANFCGNCGKKLTNHREVLRILRGYDIYGREKD